jgi:hypothetical protein
MQRYESYSLKNDVYLYTFSLLYANTHVLYVSALIDNIWDSHNDKYEDVLWNVVFYGLVYIDWRFRGAYWLHDQSVETSFSICRTNGTALQNAGIFIKLVVC